MASRQTAKARKVDGDIAAVARPDPNARICAWCANRLGEACIAQCQAEGSYRYLAPERRPDWEPPPTLPTMREMVDWSAAERLAVLWLVVHYQSQEEQ